MRYPMSVDRQVKGMAQLVLAMVLAGSSVVVGKSLTGTLPAFFIGFSTLLVAFLVLLPLAASRWQEISALTLRQWGSLFMQALCGIFLFRVLTLYGLQHTGAVQAGVIMGTTPAVLTVFAAIFLRERPTPFGMVGVGCAVGGMMVLNLSSGGAGGNQGNLLGSLLVFGAVVAEALFTIFRKKVADQVSAVSNTAGLVCISLLLLAPFAAWEYQTHPIRINLPAFLAIIYYGVFATVIAYLLWTHGVGKVSGEAAGVTTAAMPASSLLLAALILGEPVAKEHLLGCGMVMAGIALSALFNKPDRKDFETLSLEGKGTG
ncbi:putative transporter YetK [Desulfoluna limicola]|uniref:Transporter YetK n=1 Tax=Desulfoluna limicola TaxID=2810562 RepID=A0ABM7PHY8_9BACT|nr:DMT family transporter [Desulfoluna limicola]BCS96970.1 putative transporter YetK [Desulfoluna limicola]